MRLHARVGTVGTCLASIALLAGGPPGAAHVTALSISQSTLTPVASITRGDGSSIVEFAAWPTGCAPLKYMGERFEDPIRPGVASSGKVASASTVVRFAGREGGEIDQRVPPLVWNPLNATDAELEYYGYEPRPVKSLDLRQWESDASAYKSTDAVGLCVKADTSHAQYFSSIWSGLEGRVGSVTKMYATVNVPTHTNFCGASSVHAAWVGIGGDGVSQLVQNGIDQDSGGSAAWYELIKPGYDSRSIQIAMSVHAGDLINLSTQYFVPGSPNGGFYGGVQFGFHNLTTGVNSPTSIINSYAGYPASSFYNGISGEAIDERYLVNGVPQQYRAFGSTSWSNARFYQNSSSIYTLIRNTPSANYRDIIMNQAGVTLSQADGTGLPADAFIDVWRGCGLVGF